MEKKYVEFLEETLRRVKNATSEEEKDFYYQLAGKLIADMKKQGIEVNL